MNAVADSKTYRDNRLKAGLDADNMPKRIAVIMDGNGRWATTGIHDACSWTRGWCRSFAELRRLQQGSASDS